MFLLTVTLLYIETINATGGTNMANKAIKDIPYKIYLSENEIPSSWYNLRADMKTKPAPLLIHRCR